MGSCQMPRQSRELWGAAGRSNVVCVLADARHDPHFIVLRSGSSKCKRAAKVEQLSCSQGPGDSLRELGARRRYGLVRRFAQRCRTVPTTDAESKGVGLSALSLLPRI